MNQAAFSTQNPVIGSGQIPGNLDHPQPVRRSSDSGNFNFATRQIDEEQHQETLQPSSGPHFSDVAVVRSGQSHELINDTTENVEILVFQVRLAAEGVSRK